MQSPARTWIDLRSAIYGRRAVRRYTGTRINRSVIEALLHAAMQAPSALNREPWAFVVVQGKERAP
ncbi:MAG: nitroreductase family protein [Halobacteriota archaeon]